MIHKGQVGAIVRLTSSTDISGATGLAIRYRKPSGATGSWTATLSGTTALQYTTEAGDLDESGIWRFQGYATYTGDTDDYTNQVSGTVSEVITV